MIKIIQSQKEFLDFTFNIKTKNKFSVVLDLKKLESDDGFLLKEHRNSKLWETVLERLLPYEDLKIGYNKYGKPYFINNKRYFNISHKDQILVIGISNNPIGVDIESTILKLDRKIHGLKYFFSKEEVDLLNQTKNSRLFGELWSLREALAKCKGVGLTLTPDLDVCCANNEISLSKSYDFSRYYYRHYVISIVEKGK